MPALFLLCDVLTEAHCIEVLRRNTSFMALLPLVFLRERSPLQIDSPQDAIGFLVEMERILSLTSYWGSQTSSLAS